MIYTTSMIKPWERLVDENHIWGTGAAIKELLGIGGLSVLVIALTMGIFTGLNGFIIAGSRLLFAMARAKIVPEVFGKVHPKHKTPHIAILATTLVALVAQIGRAHV